MAKWIRRAPPKGKIVGSSPIVGNSDCVFCFALGVKHRTVADNTKYLCRAVLRKNKFLRLQKAKGSMGELNPRPLAPEARIIPLDQCSEGKNIARVPCCYAKNKLKHINAHRHPCMMNEEKKFAHAQDFFQAKKICDLEKKDTATQDRTGDLSRVKRAS